jgi:hypothetical protein
MASTPYSAARSTSEPDKTVSLPCVCAQRYLDGNSAPEHGSESSWLACPAMHTGSMGAPDAQRSGPGIGWRERRTGPQHAAVWVRVDGTWRKGKIIEWITGLGGSGSWDVVIKEDEPGDGTPWQGRYRYDPRAIRQRHGDVPPR